MDVGPQQARLLQVGQADAPPLLLIPGALTAAQGLLPVARVLAQHYRVGVLDVSVPIGGGASVLASSKLQPWLPTQCGI